MGATAMRDTDKERGPDRSASKSSKIDTHRKIDNGKQDGRLRAGGRGRSNEKQPTRLKREGHRSKVGTSGWTGACSRSTSVPQPPDAGSEKSWPNLKEGQAEAQQELDSVWLKEAD